MIFPRAEVRVLSVLKTAKTEDQSAAPINLNTATTKADHHAALIPVLIQEILKIETVEVLTLSLGNAKAFLIVHLTEIANLLAAGMKAQGAHALTMVQDAHASMTNKVESHATAIIPTIPKIVHAKISKSAEATATEMHAHLLTIEIAIESVQVSKSTKTETEGRATAMPMIDATAQALKTLNTEDLVLKSKVRHTTPLIHSVSHKIMLILKAITSRAIILPLKTWKPVPSTSLTTKLKMAAKTLPDILNIPNRVNTLNAVSALHTSTA